MRVTRVEAVFFDVGETLISEHRIWTEWADWLAVPHSVFLSALKSVIERGEHHQQVFQRFRPGFDLERARAERAAQGNPELPIRKSDLYPDAVPCLVELRRRGTRIGIAGNQPILSERLLEEAGVPADYIASSARWGVEKPSPAFFVRVLEVASLPPERVAYVGDRLDNDVIPAVSAGMVGVFLRRGPWARVQGRTPAVERASLVIDSLAELPAALARWPRRY